MDEYSINRLGIVQPVPVEKVPSSRDNIQRKRHKDQKKHHEEKYGSGENESTGKAERPKEKAEGNRIDILA